MINELANKVPTRLQYYDSNVVKDWGFLRNEDENEGVVYERFKLHLDPSFLDPRPNAPDLAQARRLFQDYLRCIYEYIVKHFSDSVPRWAIQKIEFVFSVPTTWKDPAMIAETEMLIRGAGFGSNETKHRASIALTEAEAAAVYASKQQFKVE